MFELDELSKDEMAFQAEVRGFLREHVTPEMAEARQDMQIIRNVRVAQGDPAQVILEEARKLGADLLVVGSHSHGAAQDIPLGRTAARLLQLSETPVYLVPMLQHR